MHDVAAQRSPLHGRDDYDGIGPAGHTSAALSQNSAKAAPAGGEDRTEDGQDETPASVPAAEEPVAGRVTGSIAGRCFRRSVSSRFMEIRSPRMGILDESTLT
jgi:hypothetical protein